MAKQLPESGDVVDATYALGPKIGSGGMGHVFLATHQMTKREVAVKFLSADYAGDGTVAQRFISEAQAAAALEHPNVVDVLDMGTSDQFGTYLVLERLRGMSLADALTKRGRLPEAEAVAIVVPLLQALHRAHGRGIVHRDLKPDNIFLANDGAGKVVPKLLDFGISHVVSPGEDPTRLTATGQLLGTPAYMSPEQVAGKDASPSFDIWSMGVVLFQCAYGRLPFSGQNIPVLFSSISYDPLPPAGDVSADLRACIEAALVKSPDQRLSSADAFANALSETSAGRERAQLTAKPRAASVAIDPDAETLAAVPSAQRELSSELNSTRVTRRKGLWFALGGFVVVATIYFAAEMAFKPRAVPFVIVSVDTDYAPERYESMVTLTKTSDGETIDRTVHTDRMPYHFELRNDDPRQGQVEFKLIDHSGKELPTKLERKLQAHPQGTVLEVFLRGQE